MSNTYQTSMFAYSTDPNCAAKCDRTYPNPSPIHSNCLNSCPSVKSIEGYGNGSCRKNKIVCNAILAVSVLILLILIYHCFVRRDGAY